jgi:hypothetical protein
MLGEKYTLDIRPTFIEELDHAAAYIELQLLNPIAADKLIADVYDAIDQTLAHPLATAMGGIRRTFPIRTYYHLPTTNYQLSTTN